MDPNEQTSAPPAGAPPAGWYPDPRRPGTQRYWDGRRWTDQIAPLPPQAQPPTPLFVPPQAPAEPRADGLVVPGYILAFLIPLVGLILGIVVASRHKGTGTNHGVWIIVVAVCSFIFWTAVLSSSDGGSGY